MRLTAAEIADATGGRVVAGSSDAVANSFSIDSRTLAGGACFVALVAARDGHEFVAKAFGAGATVAVVGRPVEALANGSGGALVQVADTLEALGALGAHARDRLGDATVVGITGSAGKTVTKDLLAAALRPARRVTASPVSFNNEAGVPLTLLGAEPDTEVVVAEMGARFAGNIRDLCAIARPSVGVVTNIGLAHAGLLGGASGIAAVKGELLEALAADGLAVLDATDAHTPALAGRTRARVVRVAAQPTDDADLFARALVLDEVLRPSFELVTPVGAAPVRLQVRGAHQVMNAVMAAAVAVELGIPLSEVAEGLGRAEAAPGRMHLERTSYGVTVLDDAYNASPTSTEAALRALAALPVSGRRYAVLGEMRELGPEADAAHHEVGRLATELGVDVVVVGPAARHIAAGARAAGATEVVEVDDVAAAIGVVTERVIAGDAVLVKASRAVGLDRVAAALLEVAIPKQPGLDGAGRS
jgi:UDP-N-acetylmuramoyl-tripeptide--D-alanyl-D-alanine ligase